MSVIEKKINEIYNKYAEFREEKVDLPKYLIAGIEARQAIKMQAHPFGPPPPKYLKTYLGMEIIRFEDVIIVE